MNSYYGCYRTRTFSEIYETYDSFYNDWSASPLAHDEVSNLISKVYYLLYAKYGDSHIASSNETRFKYQLYSTIWEYGPSWKKELEIQEKLRSMTEDELLSSGKSIANVILNPATTTDVTNDELLTTVNQQNTVSNKRDKLKAYAMLDELIKRDVTEGFIGRFKKFFISVVQPDAPLLYKENDEDDL